MIFGATCFHLRTRFSPSCDPRTAHFHLTCQISEMRGSSMRIGWPESQPSIPLRFLKRGGGRSCGHPPGTQMRQPLQLAPAHPGDPRSSEMRSPHERCSSGFKNDLFWYPSTPVVFVSYLYVVQRVFSGRGVGHAAPYRTSFGAFARLVLRGNTQPMTRQRSEPARLCDGALLASSV